MGTKTARCSRADPRNATRVRNWHPAHLAAKALVVTTIFPIGPLRSTGTRTRLVRYRYGTIYRLRK